VLRVQAKLELLGNGAFETEEPRKHYYTQKSLSSPCDSAATIPPRPI